MENDPELTLKPKINKRYTGTRKLRSPKKFQQDVEKDLARRRKNKEVLEEEAMRELTLKPSLLTDDLPSLPKKKGDKAVFDRLYHSA